jgi:hypothetical protein
MLLYPQFHADIIEVLPRRYLQSALPSADFGKAELLVEPYRRRIAGSHVQLNLFYGCGGFHPFYQCGEESFAHTFALPAWMNDDRKMNNMATSQKGQGIEHCMADDFVPLLRNEVLAVSRPRQIGDLLLKKLVREFKWL